MRKGLVVTLMAVILFFISSSRVFATDQLLMSKTKDKVIFVQDENGKFNYSWSFDKNEYSKNDFEFDKEITFKTDGLYDINKLIGNNDKKKLISFSHHGDLPGVATIKVPVSDCFNDGSILSLYYYDKKNEKVNLVEEKLEVINGFVTFQISHCSDYFVTMSIVNEASEESSTGTIIIGMIVVIVGLVGFTIFKNKK